MSGWLADENVKDSFLIDARWAARSANNALYWREYQSVISCVDTVPDCYGQTYWRMIANVVSPTHRVFHIDAATHPARTIDCGGRQISPTFLRYVVRAIELDKLFGLDGKRIIEVGGGWGGLCAVISRMFAPRSYAIWDMPEVQASQEQLLVYFGIRDVMFPSGEFDAADLFVSDYAFSELSDDEQERYSPLMRKCESGALLAPSHYRDSLLRTPHEWIAKLNEWLPDETVVEWGGEMGHYLNLARQFGDPRTTHAYIWKTWKHECQRSP